MLTPNRNRKNNAAKNRFNFSNIAFRHLILALTGCVASTTSLMAAQGTDQREHAFGFSQNPAAQTQPTREPSILINDDDAQRSAEPRPLRPSFTARAKERPAPPQGSQPGFEIPSSPTRSNFTNTNTSDFTRSPAQDGSAAVGTFAHETQEPADRFSEPQPPSAPIRSFGSSTASIQIGQSPEPDQELPPIRRNGLRSNGNASNFGDRPTPRSNFGRRDQPKVDSMTASPRFADTRPAPPAAMPGTSPARFNPQIFSQQNVRSQQSPAEHSILQPARDSSRENTPAIHNRVAATSYAQPIADETATNGKLAELIVNRYSMDNAAEPLPGEPISLTELLQQPLPTQNRPAMVSQYWETWFDWASMQNAIAYQEWLATVPNASAPGEQGLLDAARSAAENQALAAEIQLGKSQAKLIRFMPTRRSTLSPLPSDLPLVERYETHYEIYRSRNLLPTKLLGIDQMLPQTLKLINNRAQTVQKAQAAIKQNLAGYSRRQTPLASVLEAARVWRSSEQDLLASVTSYNQAIADYAFNITRRPTTPEQAVAMLIGTPKAKTEQLPQASRTAATSFGGSPDGRNTRRNAASTTGRPFGQPSSNRTAAAPTNLSRPAPTDRPAWNGGSTSSRSQPSAAASSRPTADGRPSLNTTSRSSFGGRSTGADTTSPAAFGSPSSGSNSRPSSTNRAPAGGTSSSRSTTSSFDGSGGSNSTSPSQASPTRKPFPLPKRPKPTNNSFGGFGS